MKEYIEEYALENIGRVHGCMGEFPVFVLSNVSIECRSKYRGDSRWQN